MSQSRKLSLIESLTNVAVGFGVSLASQIAIFSGYGVKLPLIDNIAITVWFTLISVARSYLLRRAFNYPWRRLAAEWKYRNADPGVCCCGANLGEGGDICYHGGCRSAKDWAIECYANGGRISTPAPVFGTGARPMTAAELRERFERVPAAVRQWHSQRPPKAPPPRVILEGRRVLTPAEATEWARERFDRESV